MVTVSYLALACLVLLAISVSCGLYSYIQLLRQVRDMKNQMDALQEIKNLPTYSMKAGLEDVISYLINLRREQAEHAISLEAIDYWIDKAQAVALKARGGMYDPETPTGQKPRKKTNAP